MTAQPDARGHFGPYGGRYVSEILMPNLYALERAWREIVGTAAFEAELDDLLTHYVGRPSPLYLAQRLTDHAGGAHLWLKREDLNHTGAHKINNCIGQVLLARHMGKTRIIAETGAGQHGVATATVAARFGMPCVVYMGEEDIDRQRLNVFRMKLLGAEVRPVTSGSRTLKDAMNEAMRDWVSHVDDTYYVIGSAAGPHPYPAMVRDFQTIIGREAKAQCAERFGGLPDVVVACVGGGSNAIGIFHPFLDDASVTLMGVEAAGAGLDTGRHAATLVGGTVGVLHGAKSYLLQSPTGQITETHSISAGLDYPGVGPEHSALRDSGRVSYHAITDDEALEAFRLLCELEGIIPALESSHAVAWAIREAAERPAGEHVLVNLSGRGDKDTHTVAKARGEGPVTDFERVGGAVGLRAIIDDFMARVFADVMIGFLFEGKNQRRIIEMEYRHAAEHLGGPVAYTGRSMREAHARSPIMGGMFMRRRKILENTLRDHTVGADVSARWLAVVDSLRAQVLGEGVDSAHCDERQQLLKLKPS